MSGEQKGHQDVYTRGPFGERLNPLKDLTPEDIFNTSSPSKQTPRLIRTAGISVPIRRPGMPLQPEDLSPRKTYRPTSLSQGPAVGVEPYLVHHLKEMAAGRTTGSQLQMPLLRNIMMPQGSSSSSGSANDWNRIMNTINQANPKSYENSDPENAISMHQATGGIPLQTGEDAVQFFAQYPTNNPLKFVYCNRAVSMTSLPQFHTNTSLSTSGAVSAGNVSQAPLNESEEGELVRRAVELLDDRIHVSADSTDGQVSGLSPQARAAAIARIASALSARDFRPYDLTVTPRKHVNPEYFTISSSGVVHIQPGRPTEFLTLMEWTHQSTSFNVLRSFRFFKHFLGAKMFRLWRSSVRYRVYCEQRNQLARNLFLARPSFCSTLLEANRLTYEMQVTELTQMQQTTPQKENELLNRQRGQREDVDRALNKKVADLERSVVQVCSAVKESARMYDHGAANEDMGASRFAHNLLRRDGTSKGKSMSMVGLKKTRALRIQRLRHAALEADMLGDFVRLIDYMQVESLWYAAIASAVRTLASLHGGRKSVFHTTIQLVPEARHPIFTPDVVQRRKAFTDIFNDMNQCVCTVPRIYSMEPFKPHISALVTSKPEPGIMVHEDPVYNASRTALDAKLLNDFRQLTATVGPFAQQRQVFEYGQNWTNTPYARGHTAALEDGRTEAIAMGLDPNSLPSVQEAKLLELGFSAGINLSVALQSSSSLGHGFYNPYGHNSLSSFNASQSAETTLKPCPSVLFSGALSVNKFKEDLQQLGEWRRSILGTKGSYEYGVFTADAKLLHDGLVAKLDMWIDNMKQFLADDIHSRVSKLKAMHSEKSEILRKNPSDLQEFADYVRSVNGCRNSLRDFVTASAELQDLLALSNEYKVDMTEPTDADEVNGYVAGFTELLQNAELSIQKRIDATADQISQHSKNLVAELMQIRHELQTKFSGSDWAHVKDTLKELEHKSGAINKCRHEIARYDEFRALFKLPPVSYEHNIRSAEKTFQMKWNFWKLVEDWEIRVKEWNQSPFDQLNISEMETKVADSFKQVNELKRQMQSDHGEVPSVTQFRERVNDFRQKMDWITQLGNKALKDTHWRKLFDKIGQPHGSMKDVTISRLSSMGIEQHRMVISQICESAIGEHALEEGIQKLDASWNAVQFTLIPYQKSRDIMILGEIEDIQILLEESQMSIQTMLGSQYIKPLQDRVDQWERRLAVVAEVLEEWLACQRTWMYLEPIFTAVDIQRQLPTESKVFAEVDRIWRELMRRTEKNPHVIHATGSNALPLLIKCNADLERIQKQLNEYLEAKRAAFPRFYFLSNDELLQILAQARDPHAVQPYMSKCFDNIKTLIFATEPVNSLELTGMMSKEGEHVAFAQPIVAKGNTENWLNDVETIMRRSLRLELKRALRNYPSTKEGALNRAEWLVSNCSQAILTVDQIIWTQNVSRAITLVEEGDANALKEFLEFSKLQIADLVNLVRSDLTALQRQLMSNLIIVDVHARDVVQDLIDRKCSSLTSFEWMKQLRVYWVSDESSWRAKNVSSGRTAGNVSQNSRRGMAMVGLNGRVTSNPTAGTAGSNEVADWEDCFVRQTTGDFPYRYEYLGNTTRLVVTPLTDRCYMTLTAALSLHNGGSPQGPAGTGKTETVKDLAKVLANQVIVFNCQDGLELATMSLFFSGLAQCGAWACFDEFNRIDAEVLSVVAQQIFTIQNAIMTNRNPFEFQGRLIPLDPSFGVFITMNPGYAGRSELPDNLKALFRPVSMMVPDYTMIAQITLFSEGFQNASVLSVKMAQLYKLASEQLSKQDHYDFGMRALKSVLVMAGGLKRRTPDIPEDVVLIRAMRDSNIPKFLSQDMPLFQGIISDLFPNVDVPEIPTTSLSEAIVQVLEERNEQAMPKLVTKVLQLHDTILVRTGVMLVGAAFTGKTTCAQVLATALTNLAESGAQGEYFNPVDIHAMNPKAVAPAELFGSTNALTNEWTDGLASGIIRDLSEETSRLADNSNDSLNLMRRKWVVFDGPVDALWIENMNTVLDDSKVLCLVNLDRIAITPQMTMMFEVEDLRHASPATVSRCGMVYMDSSDLAWVALVDTWAQNTLRDYPLLYASVVNLVVDVLKTHGPALLKFVRSNAAERIVTNNNQLIFGCLQLFDGFCADLFQAFRPQHVAGTPGTIIQEQAAAGSTVTMLTTPLNANAPVLAGSVAALDQFRQQAFMRCGRTIAHDPVDSQQPQATQSFDLNSPPAVASSPTFVSPDFPADEASVLRLAGLQLYLAITWSIGASILETDRPEFSSLLRSRVASLIAPSISPTVSCYDVVVDPTELVLTTWERFVPTFVYEPAVPYFSILVPTVENIATAHILESMVIGKGANVLLAGETGVGKTVGVQGFLRDYAEALTSVVMQYSEQTPRRSLTDAVEFAFEKRGFKSILAPHRGRRGVIVCDDMNMPQLEKYEAQPPLEVLRQVIDQGGFYDMSKKNHPFKSIRETVYVGTMAPPGGGRNKCSQRLTRHFHLLWLAPLTTQSLQRIFTSILDGFFGYTAAHIVPNPQALSTSVVRASVDLYQSCVRTLLPTPSKSHYTFNLRDLSKVVQGICQVRAQSVHAVKDVHRLWLHESARVFRDRLVDEFDRTWFDQQCMKLMRSVFGEDYAREQLINLVFADFGPIQPSTTQALANAAAVDAAGNPLYPIGLEPTEKPYEEQLNEKALLDIINTQMTEYNVVFQSQMQLVLFPDAMRNLVRIARILRQPRGHALLVGMGGSGRQSLTKLAAFMLDYKAVSIQITSNYTVEDWHENLKALLDTAGVQNLPVVFMLSDSQIVFSSFLEDINNLLNTGSVPNLYENDELDAIVIKCRPFAKQAGRGESREAALEQFNHQVRENLHIVLMFSPIGDDFRNRVRMFPSLVNCCSIVWFDAWPNDALQLVSERAFLTFANPTQSQGGAVNQITPHSNAMAMESDLQSLAGNATSAQQMLLNPTLREQLSKACVEIHQSVQSALTPFFEQYRRHVYVTPLSYLNLIDTYTSMLEERHKTLSTQLQKYRQGLLKLKQTNATVADLRGNLIELQPQLERTSVQTAELLKDLEKEQKEANESRALCQLEADETEVQTREVAAIADECKTDLDEAQPALDHAKHLVSQLDRPSLNTIRAYPNPPAMVRKVMEAVCIVLDAPPDWESAKRLMDARFATTCIEYKPDTISDRTLRRLEKYINDPDFQPKKMEEVAAPAAVLCAWVIAIHRVGIVVRAIKPKKEALALAQKNLREAQAKLDAKQTQLRITEARVAGLQQRYANSLADRDEVEAAISHTKVKLTRAEQLVAGLGTEEQRWEQRAVELRGSMDNIVGNVLLAASSVAYLGAFTADFRARLIQEWIHTCARISIPVDLSFSLSRVLDDPIQERQWRIQGLPADNFSVENAHIALRGIHKRWPLMVDPQDQANRWIKALAKRDNLQTIQPGSANWRNILENAIRYGQPVLLEGVGQTLDSSLEPLLGQQVFRRGGQTLIRLGDTDIPYAQQFRLYITTRLSNPHYLPNIFVRVSVVNFTVTSKGLEDQLLSSLCASERPDLEMQVDTLPVQIAADKAELANIEGRILNLLHETTGNLLDDESLIDTLSQSRVTASAVAARMSQSEQTMAAIDAVREEYRPVARHASMLYFAIAELSSIESMYQYSLLYFGKLYSQVIRGQVPQEGTNTKKDSEDKTTVTEGGSLAKQIVSVGSRVKNLVIGLTNYIYNSVVRGLFVRDRLFFAFLIAFHLCESKKLITDIEASFFARGVSAIKAVKVQSSFSSKTDLHTDNQKNSEAPGHPTSPNPWLSDKVWAILFESKQALEEVKSSIANDPTKQFSTFMQETNENEESEAKLNSQSSSNLNDVFGAASALAFLGEIYNELSETGAAARGWQKWHDSSDGISDEVRASIAPVTGSLTSPAKLLGASGSGVLASLPNGWSNKLSLFQALLVVKLFRPDLLPAATEDFIMTSLGPSYVASVPFDMQEIFAQSSSQTPTLFILSPGADPLPYIQTLAHTCRLDSSKLKIVSMGKGQGDYAEELIESGRREGHWVILQNCHLAESWMPSLERTLDRAATAVVNDGFRLWLTSMPLASFSVTVLQNSLKVTTEPPRGVNNNLVQIFNDVSESMYNAVDTEVYPAQALAYRRLLYSLAAFHSTALERRKFGPLGFNVQYDWMLADLTICQRQLAIWMSENIKQFSTSSLGLSADSIAGKTIVPWDMLHYVFGEVNYGGRVTDDKDQRCIASLLTRFMTVGSEHSSEGSSIPTPNEEVLSSLSKVKEFCLSLEDDTPEVFGLHDNASIELRLSESAGIVDRFINVTAGGGGGSGSGSDASTSSSDSLVIALAMSLESRVPEDLDKSKAHPSAFAGVASLEELLSDPSGERVDTPMAALGNPLGVFLSQEIDRMNKLLAVLRRTLESLRRSIRGEEVMSASLEQMYRALVFGTVPSEWTKAAYLSMKPLASWFDDMVERVAMYRQWLLEGVPQIAWMSGYFFPQGFLTALLQTYARANKISIDTLYISSNVLPYRTLEEVTANKRQVQNLPGVDPRLGVIVRGMYLQGAAWNVDVHSVGEAAPRQLFDELPLIHLYAKVREEGVQPSDVYKVAPTAPLYSCPVYKTVARAGELSTTGHSTNYVISLVLPSQSQFSNDHWVRRGAAIVLQLSN